MNVNVCIVWQDFSPIIPPQGETQRNQNPLNEFKINLSSFQGSVKKGTSCLLKKILKGVEIKLANMNKKYVCSKMSKFEIKHYWKALKN